MCLMFDRLAALANKYHPFQSSSVYYLYFSVTLYNFCQTHQCCVFKSERLAESRKSFLLDLLKTGAEDKPSCLDVPFNLEWRSFSPKTCGCCSHVGKPSSLPSSPDIRLERDINLLFAVEGENWNITGTTHLSDHEAFGVPGNSYPRCPLRPLVRNQNATNSKLITQSLHDAERRQPV